MVLKMATPWKHPGSGIFLAAPPHSRGPGCHCVGKREEKISLRTRVPIEAKVG